MDFFGGDVTDEWCQQGESSLNWGIIETLLKRGDHDRNEQSYGNAADGHGEEDTDGSWNRKRPDKQCRDGETVGDKGRGIVDQAFALDNCEQAPWDWEALGDAGGGDCVGRRNDCAKQHSSREGKPGEQVAREETDCNGCKKH